MPVFLILGARVLVASTDWLASRLRRSSVTANIILLFLAIGIIRPGVQVSLAHDQLYLSPNTGRIQAREWIVRNIPPGATIMIQDGLGGLPQLPSQMYSLQVVAWRTWASQVPLNPNDLRQAGIDYAIANLELFSAPLDASKVRLLKLFQDDIDPTLPYDYATSITHKIFVYEIEPPNPSLGNLYSTLRQGQPRTGAVNAPSFENLALLQEDWFAKTVGPASNPEKAISETTSLAHTEGQYALHLAVQDHRGSSRVEVAQVIPREYVDQLANFQMDFFPISTEITGTHNRIALAVTAQS
ncbi:MAG: hypothetical protein WCG94_09270, partial [Methanothrix sp.]